MSGCRVESGFQLYARLSSRTALNNLWPDLFSDGGPGPQQVVEIVGDSSTGKTLLITELVARCLLPERVNEAHVGGKNSGAIVINTDHHFHLFKLIDVMEALLRAGRVSGELVRSTVLDCLARLVVVDCYDSQQMYLALYHAQSLLAADSGLSLVVVDSLLAYYWTDRLTGAARRAGAYRGRLLRLLQTLTHGYSVVLVFSGPAPAGEEAVERCAPAPAPERVNYRVRLQRAGGGGQLQALVTLPDNSTVARPFRAARRVLWAPPPPQ